MKISTRFIKKISCSIGMLVLLAPLTVLAHTKVVVIPLGDGESGGCGVTYQAGVEKSGQTRCYDAGGTEIPCVLTWEDGELQRGVAWPNPRFIDHGDDTVMDNLTGLMWTKNANLFVPKTWTDALATCEACTVGGHTDWHLPQVKELQSLIHFGYANPAMSNANGTGQWTPNNPFTNVVSINYWSSTTYASQPQNAWFVNLGVGFVSDDGKGFSYYVWCVRGGPN